MLTITLQKDVEKSLTAEAKRRDMTVDRLVNDWLKEYLWQEMHRKIDEEAVRFQAQHAELYKQYAGKCIAMREGVVLDVDEDLIVLHDRIRATYGDEPILMTPVNENPIQTYKIRSPRWGRAT